VDEQGGVTEEQVLAWQAQRSAARAQAAQAAIQATLEANRCALRAVPRITEDGRIVADVVVVAL
jgi:hypothetical protein